MKKISTAAAARLSGLTKSRVVVLAREGQIPGAEQLDNGVWLIPAEWAGRKAIEQRERAGNITVAEAAKRAGVSRTAIYKALERGNIRGTQHRRGKNQTSWSVDRESLAGYRAKRA